MTRLSVETERTYIFRSWDGARAMWCAACGAEVGMATVAGAAGLAGLCELVIYRLIESGTLHFTKAADGLLLVCLNSLRKEVILSCSTLSNRPSA